MVSSNMLLGFIGLACISSFAAGCGDVTDLQPEAAQQLGSSVQALSANGQSLLAWGNGWIKDITDDATLLQENAYSSDTELVRAAGSVKAINRTVCGTLVTQMIQKSTLITANNFTNSFNKPMSSCDVGAAGTNSPNAAQYQYKIANCATTGPIKFDRRTHISDVEAGDVLAVSYPERTDVTGHTMIVRSAPIADPGLPAGPQSSTAYAVEVIDSTSKPHGSSAAYPDWRPGVQHQGLGHGTFVVYADVDGLILGSRWSPTDPYFYDQAAHPLSFGGLK